MRIFSYAVSQTHLWELALLILIVIISSVTLNTFPFALFFGVVLAAIIDCLIRKFYRKHKFKIPVSGIITGLIIGSIAPINAPLLLIAAAVAIAIVSKFFIRVKGSNIFNPAVLGLLIGLAVFSIGDVWWAAGSYNLYGIAFSITPLLVIAAYKAKRLTIALSFIIVVLLSSVLLGAYQFSFAALLPLIFSVNYYFAFGMLTDPKTSPNRKIEQAGFGVLTALLYIAFSFFSIIYGIFIAVLLSNVLYTIVRKDHRAVNQPQLHQNSVHDAAH